MVGNGRLSQRGRVSRIYHPVHQETCLKHGGELIEIAHQENNGNTAKWLVGAVTESLVAAVAWNRVAPPSMLTSSVTIANFCFHIHFFASEKAGDCFMSLE